MLWLKKKETIGLFIIHGFLGNPDTSFGNLPVILKKNKIKHVLFETIQAHGPNDDINSFDYKIAKEQIERDYRFFKEQYDKTYIIGFSLGGVLATFLASKVGTDRLVLVAPALKYGGNRRMSDKIIEHFKSNDKTEIEDNINISDKDATKLLKEYLKSEKSNDGGVDYQTDFVDRLGKIKPSVFVNFVKMIASIRRSMGYFNVPTRFYISENDDLVPTDAVFYGFDRITNYDKRILILSKVKHRILASELKYDVYRDIFYFLYGKEKIKWPKESK